MFELIDHWVTTVSERDYVDLALSLHTQLLVSLTMDRAEWSAAETDDFVLLNKDDPSAGSRPQPDHSESVHGGNGHSDSATAHGSLVKQIKSDRGAELTTAGSVPVSGSVPRGRRVYCDACRVVLQMRAADDAYRTVIRALAIENPYADLYSGSDIETVSVWQPRSSRSLRPFKTLRGVSFEQLR